jgi:hypothetical protein
LLPLRLNCPSWSLLNLCFRLQDVFSRPSSLELITTVVILIAVHIIHHHTFSSLSVLSVIFTTPNILFIFSTITFL